MGHADTIDIDPGYQVELIDGTFLHHDHYEDDTQATCVIGPFDAYVLGAEELKKPAIDLGTAVGSTLITDKMSFQVSTRNVASWSISVQLTLKRTEKAMAEWRLKTWNALEAGRKVLMDDYNDALRQAKAAATASLWAFHGGHNPADNMIMMRQELKKACITVMTDQHFEGFGAVAPITSSGQTYMQLNAERSRAQGSYVRFFEQAFEWDNMTWITYPYFWGRKEAWFDKLDYVDSDPMLQEFIRAGFARTNVPIRPGFEGAIDHFLTTGDVWLGGPLPSIGSELFVPIASEIAERLGKPSNSEEKYGDPWEVRVPTNLVMLRESDKLPVWEKKDGEWVDITLSVDGSGN